MPDDKLEPTTEKSIEATRSSWICPDVLLLRRFDVEHCRTDLRPETYHGRQLVNEDNDLLSATKMGFYLLDAAVKFFKKYGKGKGRPKYNQIEAHLLLCGQKLPRRLSDVLKGQTDGCDPEQAREALRFLLLGFPHESACPEAHAIWSRVENYFFRLDEDHPEDGPRFMLKVRRPHGTACSATELAGEFRRFANKLKYGYATEVEVVWVLGPLMFPRNDLVDEVPDAILDAINIGVKVEFIWTENRPECWRLPTTAKTSSSLLAFTERLGANPKHRFINRSIPPTMAGDTGVWAFINPCNEMIYCRVVPDTSAAWAREEALFWLPGHDGSRKNMPIPLVCKSNTVELRAFKDWLTGIRLHVKAT